MNGGQIVDLLCGDLRKGGVKIEIETNGCGHHAASFQVQQLDANAGPGDRTATSCA